MAKISRSAYYRFVARPERYRSLKDILIKEQEQIRYIYGYRRMKTLLRGKYGIVINHKALRRIMKETGTQAVIRRRKANAMYHTEGAPLVAENRLNRNFAASILKHKYVTDITYIPIPGGMTYLSVMLDLYNREVVSYVVSKTQDASLSCQTVENLARKTSLNGAMIHSDQGVHYTNGKFVELLQRHGAIQSMSRKGNCWDNAVMENFFWAFQVRMHPNSEKSIEILSGCGVCCGRIHGVLQLPPDAVQTKSNGARFIQTPFDINPIKIHGDTFLNTVAFSGYTANRPRET